MKFVGHDGESCLKKLTSKAFDKFFEDGKVDRIEIPADFYDEIKNQLDRTSSLFSQVNQEYRNGNVEVIIPCPASK